MTLKSKNGYDISYQESIPEDSNTVIIAMHGFAGDKTSTCISMLEQAVNKEKIGLIKFDWPAHGESNTDGYNLTVEKCLDDLDSIINYLKQKNNKYNLIAFGTSFGGYLTLLYNYYHPHTFKTIILRSPAIKMYSYMLDDLSDEKLKNEMEEKGYYEFGFERMIKITKEFYDSLKNNDVIKLYGDDKLENVSIIHGTNDDTVPFNDALEFSKKHSCHLYPVEGADHRYKNDGELEKVIDITIGIINN